MSTDPRDQRNDPALEQDLETLRSAWRGGDQPEPPEMVDLAVMNSARRAVVGRGRRSMRWLGAFATATVVVLALTLVIEQEPQSPAPMLEEGDGFRLERAAPQKQREQAVRKNAGETAAPTELRMKQNAAPRPALAADAESTFEAEEESFVPQERQDGSEAEAWIERLLALRERGRDEELARELAAFRKAFPDYPLPPALRD